MKLPISAIVIVHNEETVIRRCLNSFADIVDELLIIHDGECNDGTLEIAKEFTNKIYKWEKKGNAEHHRAKAIALASHKWVLQVDADEYLSTELRDKLQRVFQKDNTDIYEFYWPIWFNNQYYPFGYKRALYNKEKVYFIPVNHEYVKPVDSSVKISKIDELLHHKPVNSHFLNQSFRKKLLPRARLHARRLLIPFSEYEKWNCKLSDWDWRMRIRLHHPIVLGVFGTFFWHLFISLRRAIKYKNIFYVKIGLFLSLWNASVFYYYFIYKNFQNFHKD